MLDKGQKTIRIKWVRSGIGFSYRQKRVVQSLGLRKLNQVVEKPDTPQIRGLVARAPHLLDIVGASVKPAWTAVPEYTIYPPAETAATPVEPAAAGEPGQIEPAANAESTAAQPPSASQEQGAEAPPAESAPKVSAEAAAAQEPDSATPASEQGSSAGEDVSPEEGQPGE